jgi:hypothetical protein
MSKWRREASERLPELQWIIASKLVDSPMMLWIELNQEFARRCEKEPLPLDLLRRIWGYCEWCLSQGTSDIQTAAALGFCEHLIDTPKRTAVLPMVMRRSDFLDLRELLEYRNTSAKVDECLKNIWR